MFVFFKEENIYFHKHKHLEINRAAQENNKSCLYYNVYNYIACIRAVLEMKETIQSKYNKRLTIRNCDSFRLCRKVIESSSNFPTLDDGQILL